VVSAAATISRINGMTKTVWARTPRAKAAASCARGKG
jgi:hypothetical protein